MGPVIIILGPPGAGKSTQAKLLAKKLDGVYVSTGDLLRNSADPKIRELLDRGELAPSGFVSDLVEESVAKVAAEQAIILDGVTRMPKEATWLERKITEEGRSAEVIFINLPRSICLERITGRGRSDDEAEIFAKRWKNFEQEMVPVVDHYRQKGWLSEVDGNGSVEQVMRRIGEALER